MSIEELREEYFKWMLVYIEEGRVYMDEGEKNIKLFRKLFNTEFQHNNFGTDENRYDEGNDLKRRFEYEMEYPRGTVDIMPYGCNMMEFLLGVADRIENIAYDDQFGDRTSEWFWHMIGSLGLGTVYATDGQYDEAYIERCLDKFFKRKYRPNGMGGLFTLRHCDEDLRDLDIWCQLNLFVHEHTIDYYDIYQSSLWLNQR